MNKYGKTAIIIASTMLPLTLLISGIIAWNLKSANPDNVDITASLAYLKQILSSTLIVFGISWAASLALAVTGLKKDANKEFGKLAIVVLALITITSIGAGIANNKVSDAEEAYRKQQTQNFLQKFE